MQEARDDENPYESTPADEQEEENPYAESREEPPAGGSNIAVALYDYQAGGLHSGYHAMIHSFAEPFPWCEFTMHDIIMLMMTSA